MGKLSGKRAIVTGATSGMGRATAALFAREGARLLLNGRDSERGAEVLEEVRSCGAEGEFVYGDVSRFETNQKLVEECLDRFGGVDVVAANAGILGLGSVTEVPLEVWRDALGANLDSVFYLLRCAIPPMQQGGGGSIVVNGSIAAFKGFPNHAAYCASKAALVALVRQAAIDYGPAIRINAVCPGPVDTPLIWSSAEAFPDPSKAVAAAGERTVLKRLGAPDDIARAALFLASEDSSWITGASLVVDGGIMTGV